MKTLQADQGNYSDDASYGSISQRSRASRAPGVMDLAVSKLHVGAHSPAVTIVIVRLKDQVVELKRHEPDVRRGDEVAIHKMRVAIRRIRAALKTFAPLFGGSTLVDIQEKLHWTGVILGRARDISVLRHRLNLAISELPSDQVLGPVQLSIDRRLGAEMAEAREELIEALDHPRYAALLGALSTLLDAPHTMPIAHKRADKVLPRLVSKEQRRLRRRVDLAFAAVAPRNKDMAFHEARKTAKRLRYAAETIEPVSGSIARRLSKKMEKVQEVLGVRQDAVVAGEFLREEGARSGGSAGENGYTYGILASKESDRAESAGREFAELWRRLGRKEVYAALLR